jgi:type III secretion protein T
MDDLFKQLKPLLIAMTLCTPRMLATFLIAPFFNTETITGATRNCIVMVFVLIVFPTVLPFIRTHDISVGFVFATVIKEAVIGALIGYLAALFFHAIGAVGQLIDYQRGAGFASLMDPATGTQTSPMGQLFSQMTIILFFTSGGFVLFLSGMYESYRIWPIQTFWPRFDEHFVPFFLAGLDDFMALVLVLAAPVLIALFLSELGLGLINRFAPQLNVFFLSMPVKSALAVLIIIFYMQILLTFIRDGFIHHFDIFGMLRQVVH